MLVSVLVVVTVMGGMAAAVVHIVDVITVRNRHMSAALAVSVVVPLMRRVAAGRFAFVEVIAMLSMQVTVVHIVDVITVRNRDMPTPVPMRMVVTHMLLVSYSVHLVLLATDFDGLSMLVSDCRTSMVSYPPPRTRAESHREGWLPKGEGIVTRSGDGRSARSRAASCCGWVCDTNVGDGGDAGGGVVWLWYEQPDLEERVTEPSLGDLEQQREWLYAELAGTGDFRRGSIRRLKLSGMRWNIPGATGILTLRCQHASGRWEQICTQPHNQTATA